MKHHLPSDAMQKTEINAICKFLEETKKIHPGFAQQIKNSFAVFCKNHPAPAKKDPS